MGVKKISVEMESENGQRFAIDHAISEEEARYSRGRRITLRIGFESITLPVLTFQNLLKAVTTAEIAGSEYPEDWKPYYGLAPELANPSNQE